MLVSKRAKGVTLVELVVAVAIIAILAVIAYPSYIRSSRESNRADAQVSVVATQSIVQRYLTENNKVNITSADMALSQFSKYATSSSTPVLSNGGYYIITIVPDSSSYTINATATAAGVNGDCSSSSLRQCADTTCRVISISAGAKQSTNSSGSVANADTTTCW